MCFVVQNAKTVCIFRDVPLESHHYSSPRDIGGNWSNSFLDLDSDVQLFKAVVASGRSTHQLCHIGDYIRNWKGTAIIYVATSMHIAII